MRLLGVDEGEDKVSASLNGPLHEVLIYLRGILDHIRFICVSVCVCVFVCIQRERERERERGREGERESASERASDSSVCQYVCVCLWGNTD